MPNHHDLFLLDEKLDSDLPLPEDGAAWPSERQAPSAYSRVLGAVVHEIVTIATFVATAASVLSFAAHHPDRAQRLLGDLPAYLPPAPALTQGAVESLLHADLPLQLINRLQDFGPRIELARQMTRLQGARLSAGHTVEPPEIDELITVWRLLCETTLDLLQLLGPLAEGSDGDGAQSADPDDVTPRQSVERLLSAAALGGWPCVARDGSVALPGWLEQRRDRRYRVEQDCTLRHAGRSWPVRTIELSRQGAGLLGAPVGVEAGSRAELRIGFLFAIVGTVVWRSADKFGFRFDTPIESLADLIGDTAAD